MDDPREGPAAYDPRDNRIITRVQKMDFDQGSGYGFNLLDEETMRPCFRLVFKTPEDAERGRGMMAEIMDHAIWYETV
jgi:hypothetical protein